MTSAICRRSCASWAGAAAVAKLSAGCGRTIPGFHDGGSLAGNESSRTSSSARSAARRACRSPASSTIRSTPTMAGTTAATPLRYSIEVLVWSMIVPYAAFLWWSRSSQDSVTQFRPPVEVHDEQPSDDRRRQHHQTEHLDLRRQPHRCDPRGHHHEEADESEHDRRDL